MRLLGGILRWKLSVMVAVGLVGVASVATAVEMSGRSGGAAFAKGIAGYGWPVRPFDRQHPVRGVLGDPRTIFAAGPTCGGVLRGSAQLDLHTGVDISAPNGTAVFPVRDGRVAAASASKSRMWVVVESADGTVFEYWHIRPRVRVGEWVTASRTVIGKVAELSHVHLTEVRSGRYVNPLAVGHLSPYADRTRPRVEAIRFQTDDAGTPVMAGLLRGRVYLVAEADDAPALSAPGIWHDMPVAPASVQWRIEDWTGRIVVAERVAFDFGTEMPPTTFFSWVYVRGTYQNMCVFGSHYSYGQPGVYLFNLAHGLFDTRQLRDGVYDLVVTAIDTRGNSGSRTQRFTVQNRVAPAPT
jgi:murein DD-endopeptidase MepM/ murein hydrolase activator NlpD